MTCTKSYDIIISTLNIHVIPYKRDRLQMYPLLIAVHNTNKLEKKRIINFDNFFTVFGRNCESILVLKVVYITNKA